jgi:hypothetical protein
LPRSLVARIQEFVNVTMESLPEARRIGPDVRIVGQPDQPGGGTATAIAAASEIGADPLIVPLPYEEPVLHEIRILDREAGDRVITVIEFLSLVNRRSGRAAYLRKQQELIEAGVNLVEIDLLRSGPWIIADPPDDVFETHRGPYRVCVVRARAGGRAELYRASYRSPLPSVGIPLRQGDADARLALQPLIEQAYHNGPYDRISYQKDPVPPLPLEEREWVDQLLRQAGRRSVAAS